LAISPTWGDNGCILLTRYYRVNYMCVHNNVGHQNVKGTDEEFKNIAAMKN